MYVYNSPFLLSPPSEGTFVIFLSKSHPDIPVSEFCAYLPFLGLTHCLFFTVSTISLAMAFLKIVKQAQIFVILRGKKKPP